MLYERITNVLLVVKSLFDELENPLDRHELGESLQRQLRDVWLPEFKQEAIALIQGAEGQQAETSDGRAYKVKDELRHKIERVK